jgi:hypothetical protein
MHGGLMEGMSTMKVRVMSGAEETICIFMLLIPRLLTECLE